MHSRGHSRTVALPSRLTVVATGVWCATCIGCASIEGPEVLHLDAAAYPAAFGAAMEAARTHGMTPTLRDQRTGVIETEPSIASSILEPWRSGNASLGQALENTIAFQRRRARFEFTAGGLHPARPIGGEPPAGPDLFGTRTQQMDLSRYEGELELRAWVYVERAYAPGIRRNTWTRRKTTRTTIVPTEDGAERPPTLFWLPISRDSAFERRLLGAVERVLQRQAEHDGEPGTER